MLPSSLFKFRASLQYFFANLILSISKYTFAKLLMIDGLFGLIFRACLYKSMDLL